MQDVGAVLLGIMVPVQSASSFTSKKILSVRKTVTLIASLKRKRKTVGLCQGGFDLLHPGHVKHFESAKKRCNVLIVSVTADRWVSERKGEGRPIFPDTLRAYMIAGLSFVDYVVITDVKSGVDVIGLLKPSFYIKGPDFIGKETPGITLERQAITAVGGTMLYTNDPKLSTTEIIDSIQKDLVRKNLLLVLDRDGTLIANDDFFGRKDNWADVLTLNEAVVSFVSFLQTKYKTTNIVASNQPGIARKYFTDQRVKEINSSIDLALKKRGIVIDNWQYCPDVDAIYAAGFPKGTFHPSLVKNSTKRKPSTAMVEDGLREVGKSLKDFDAVLVLGDREVDEGLAKNLSAHFINVKGKTYDDLLTALEG